MRFRIGVIDLGERHTERLAGILPPFLDLVMRQNQLEKYRREVVAAANGRVLEVGVGSGLNFPLYGKQVEIVVGIDPSPPLLADARRRAAAAGVRAEFLQGSATAIPLADNAVDTVVMTSLCSIADPLAGTGAAALGVLTTSNRRSRLATRSAARTPRIP